MDSTIGSNPRKFPRFDADLVEVDFNLAPIGSSKKRNLVRTYVRLFRLPSVVESGPLGQGALNLKRKSRCSISGLMVPSSSAGPSIEIDLTVAKYDKFCGGPDSNGKDAAQWKPNYLFW